MTGNEMDITGKDTQANPAPREVDPPYSDRCGFPLRRRPDPGADRSVDRRRFRGGHRSHL